MRKFTICIIMFLTCSMLISMHASYAQHMKSVDPKSAQAGSGATPDAISGKIVETMNSGGYTYVLLENGGEKTWVAVGEMKVAVGQEIAFAPGHEMIGFTSKTLNRTFDRIVFSTGPVSGSATSGPHKSSGESHGSEHPKAEHPKAGASSSESIKVEKASGMNAYTVAELYEKAASLNKKSIIVRGKVVRVSVGILNKNWLHIQDGTGKQSDKTNDIVVTTQDEPSVGDTVTMIGTLYTEKDFGSGYKYDVIVEEATIKQ